MTTDSKEAPLTTALEMCNNCQTADDCLTTRQLPENSVELYACITTPLGPLHDVIDLKSTPVSNVNASHRASNECKKVCVHVQIPRNPVMQVSTLPIS